MKLGRRSQSMPWIFCAGIISTWGWGGELEGREGQTQISRYEGTSTIPLFPLPPSTHTLQPAIISPFLPSSSVLFIWFFVFRLCCLFAPGQKTLSILSMLHYVCVYVFESALKWHIDSQCSIFSHLAHYYSASQPTLYFSPSLSISVSIMLLNGSVYEECCIAVIREGFGVYFVSHLQYVCLCVILILQLGTWWC